MLPFREPNSVPVEELAPRVPVHSVFVETQPVQPSQLGYQETWGPPEFQPSELGYQETWPTRTFVANVLLQLQDRAMFRIART
jgi:hypothetical protein